MINEDPRLWKRNYKLGMLPGDISVQAKVRLLSKKDFQPKPNSCIPKHTPHKRQCWRREVTRKANRRWRHEFRALSPEELLDNS
jgi:hypothetical protein